MTNHQIGRFALDVHANPHLKFQHLRSSICLPTSAETQPMVQHAMEILKTRSPKTHSTSRLWSLLGQALDPSHLLSSGEDCRSGFANSTKVKALGMDWEGHSGSSWPQTQPIVKLNKLSGKLTLSRLWSKQNPKVKLVRLLGKIIPSRLWLKSRPNANLCKQLGSDTRSRLWWKSSPKANLRRLLGKVTLLRLLLKWQPNVKFCKFLGRSTCSKPWLKLYPNVKLCKPSDEVTRSRLSPKKLSTVKLLQTA